MGQREEMNIRIIKHEPYYESFIGSVQLKHADKIIFWSYKDFTVGKERVI